MTVSSLFDMKPVNMILIEMPQGAFTFLSPFHVFQAYLFLVRDPYVLLCSTRFGGAAPIPDYDHGPESRHKLEGLCSTLYIMEAMCFV